MSSFFVEPETIHAAVELIALHEGWSDPADFAKRQELGKSLYWMNMDAMQVLYGAGGRLDYAGMCKAALGYRNERMDDLPVAVLGKAADCLAYQCSEEGITEDPRFLRLQLAVDAYKAHHGKRHDLPWGLDAAKVADLRAAGTPTPSVGKAPTRPAPAARRRPRLVA